MGRHLQRRIRKRRHRSRGLSAEPACSVRVRQLLLIVSERFSEAAEAYEAAGQFEQALVEIRAPFIAGAESFELMQPCQRALHDPAHFAESGAVSDAASGDHRLDAALP